jgi:4-amino-4-deoxy-L-arabinose transferase-like glycosyltransferase
VEQAPGNVAASRGRDAALVFTLAAVLRVAFVLWAPGEPVGDGLFYHQHALDLMQGNGYVNLDRSPANTWMPGWPAWLSGVYSVFGAWPRAAMLLNALLGAATAALVLVLGRLLFDDRVGRAAGLLYAVWPGVIYYCATLFNETLFSFLFATTLVGVVLAARSDERREWHFASAGLALGLCAWVKAEPLVFALPFALFVWVQRRSGLDFARSTALLVVVAGAILSPWTLRNHRAFDRFIPTAAGGGSVVAAANHPGASGGNDLAFLIAYIERLGVTDATQSEQNIAMNDDGWRVARAFMREHPAEALSVMGRKLALTYLDDSDGAMLVRGFFGKERWHLSETTWRRLVAVANTWWAAMALLVGVGVAGARRWRFETRVLVLSLLGTWLALHLVFLGGSRFHHPETLVLALLAGAGWVSLRDRVSALREGGA